MKKIILSLLLFSCAGSSFAFKWVVTDPVGYLSDSRTNNFLPGTSNVSLACIYKHRVTYEDTNITAGPEKQSSLYFYFKWTDPRPVCPQTNTVIW